MATVVMILLRINLTNVVPLATISVVRSTNTILTLTDCDFSMQLTLNIYIQVGTIHTKIGGWERSAPTFPRSLLL